MVTHPFQGPNPALGTFMLWAHGGPSMSRADPCPVPIHSEYLWEPIYA